jgi:hypothetical protein
MTRDGSELEELLSGCSDSVSFENVEEYVKSENKLPKPTHELDVSQLANDYY